MTGLLARIGVSLAIRAAQAIIVGVSAALAVKRRVYTTPAPKRRP